MQIENNLMFMKIILFKLNKVINLKNRIFPLFLWLIMIGSLSSLVVSCGGHYRIDKNPPPIPQAIIKKPIRLALVLGGGGARGMAHVGVLEEFEKANIPIDVIVGCSAGSIVGALYADHPNAQRVKTLLAPLKKCDMLDLDIWNARYGLVQGRCLKSVLKRSLCSTRFEDLKIPLYIVATDIMEGKLITFSSGPIIPAVHASSAVPFVFVPVLFYGRWLVDGGVADPIPVTVAKELEADIIVAVDLSELLQRTCPTNLFGIARRAAEIKFLLQTKSCVQGADVVISPDLIDVGMFDDTNSQRVYEAGRKAASKAIPQILKLLAEKELACDLATIPDN